MGFWDSPFGEVLKFGGKVVVSTAVAGSIVASGGATVPLLLATGATGYATGKVVKTVGKECDCELLEWVGETVSDTGVGVFTGGLGSGADKAIKMAYKIPSTNGANVLTRGSIFTKGGLECYDYYSKVTEKGGRFSSAYHGHHKSQGIKYDRNCPTCLELL
jgi:hypothetical protein